MPHPSDMGVSGRLGVPVATCFPMMDHARLSQFAPYKNEAVPQLPEVTSGRSGWRRSRPKSRGDDVGEKDAESPPSPKAHCARVQFALTVQTPTGRTVARSFSAVFFACRMTSSSCCCSARSNALLAMTFSALDHFKAANRCLDVWDFGAGETGHVGVLPRGIYPHVGLEKSRFLTRGH